MQKAGFFIVVFILLTVGLPFCSGASTKPKWEMGLGYFNFQIPHYLGSNHYYRYEIPLPVFYYRFENLELGRDSRLFLFDSDFFQIDIALSGNWPVISEDEDAEAPDNHNESDAVINSLENYTRRGMSDIPIIASVGIRGRFYFSDHLIVEIPYYHGGKLESGFGHAGNTHEVNLRLEFFDKDSDHEFGFVGRQLYGDKKYNRLFYEVSAEDVLPDREGYEAKEGLVAASYGISFWFQLTERLSLSGRYLTHNMDQSVVKESPLVESKNSRDYFFMISYSFFQSDQTVTIP